MKSSHLHQNRAFTRFLLGISLTLLFSCPSFGFVIGTVKTRAMRTVDASNLRQIAQATIIYAEVHNDNLPQASDIWDYARLLAEEGGLDYGSFWQSRVDPASESTYDQSIHILLPPEPNKPRSINPAFLKIKPHVAVALGKLKLNMPGATPLAWTRGLKPDGTWAQHSPYGESGGFIVFLGGNVQFYKNLTDEGGQLARFDGKGKTANILEALPPGTSIGEYIPTPSERNEWSHEIRRSIISDDHYHEIIPLLILISVLWTPFILLALYRCIRKRKHVARTFIIPCILTVVLLFLISIMC